MMLPLTPPFPPMEAESAAEIPRGANWQYEPKWDGFRAIVFRDGDEIELQSRAGKSLTRYFPELTVALTRMPAARFVLDGEIVIPVDDGLSFEDLLLRIHPAECRVRKLARERPARYIAFDLLVDASGKSLVDLPLTQRRTLLEDFADRYFRDQDAIRLSPATHDLEVARKWLNMSGSGLDGIIAKHSDLSYASGSRRGMEKIKRVRTAECVVGGFRYAANGDNLVGSLLLGLYDEQGKLDHVGFTTGIRNRDRAALTRVLESLIEPPGFTGRAPAGPGRWTNGRSDPWEPLKSKLVCEVQYDHFSRDRFRHGTRFLRWRPDKNTQQCMLARVQNESKSPLDLL